MTLTTPQRNRALGVLLGTAAGDALGAGYEFGPPLGPEVVVRMNGGGSFGWEPGEWTDDTSMSIPIAQALARGAKFDEQPALDGLVEAWAGWARDAKDVGVQTRQVLSGLAALTEDAARASAKAVHDQHGQSAGNGSLMRTAPLALGYLQDPDGLGKAARRVSELTHYEDDAGDACVIWTLAIRHAVLTGELDARIGLDALPAANAKRWADYLAEAEKVEPRWFDKNGWVVQALQGAWSAITHASTFKDAMEGAVRGGRDTDTVAAIAAGLAGAAYGAEAIPEEWKRKLHGWPGLAADDLNALAEQIIAT